MPMICSGYSAATLTAPARIHEPHVLAFADMHIAREAINAGMRDMQIGIDARPRRLDHMLGEAREIAGAGRTRIDRGGDAALLRIEIGIDAERGAAPINMGVEIDEAWRHDEARHILDLGRRVALEVRAEGRDLALAKATSVTASSDLRRDR